jgi:hypothetical protein
MSQKTLISYYQKKQKKSKGRISDLLSGRAKKRSEKSATTSTPAVAEASASTSTLATSSFIRERGESEMENVLIGPFTIGSEDESQTLPITRVTKRRRTEEGREEQHSDGNFQKISKNFKKFNKNILQYIIYFIRRTSVSKKKKARSYIRLFKKN